MSLMIQMIRTMKEVIVNKIIIGLLGSLFLSACASNQIYYPVRVSCNDLQTGKIEEHTAVAGIEAVGEDSWLEGKTPVLDFTDTDWHRVTIDLIKKRCSIAAYRN